MLIPLNPKDYKVSVIEDLGMIEYGTLGRCVRKANFLCPLCGSTFVAAVGDVKRLGTSSCKGCASSRAQRKSLCQEDFKMKILKDLGWKSTACGTKIRRAIFICSQCGKEFITRTDLVKLRNQDKCKSCSCKNSHFVHGGSGTRLHRIWKGMKQRCLNPNFPAYKNYGGRGITICNEWTQDFLAFSTWAKKNGYLDNLTIDRERNHKGYCPENCRFVDMRIQNNNKRNNVFLTLGPLTDTVSNWGRFLDVSAKTLSARKRSGWSDERIIREPVKEAVT